jgi:signal peptidase II
MLIGASFVIGGGIGNMIDRILHGSVTDFLHLKIGSFQTGIFNMADVSIMIGMAFLIYTSLVRRRDNSENYST